MASTRDQGAGLAPEQHWLPDALPTLSGPAILVYRVIWCIAGALALASLVLGYRAEVEAQHLSRAVYDLGMISMSSGNRYPNVKPFSAEAKRKFSGLQSVISIDGHAVPLLQKEQQRVFSGPDGASVDVELMRADGIRHHITLIRNTRYLADAYAATGTGLTWEGRRWSTYALNTIAGITWLIVAGLLFVRRPRDPVAALIAVGGVLVCINTEIVFPSAPDFVQALVLGTGQVMIVLGAITLPNGRFLPKSSMYLSIIILPLIIFSRILSMFNNQDKWYIAFLIGVTVNFILIFIMIQRYRATLDISQKLQIKTAYFGFSCLFLFNIIGFCFLYVSRATDNESSRAIELLTSALFLNLGSLACTTGLLLAVLRYGLYSADATITRSVSFGTLTLALVGIFAGSEKVVELLGEQYFGEELGALAGGIAAALAAVMIVPLHHRIEHWAQKRFQQNLLKLRQGLPVLMSDLRETAGTDQIAAAALDAIMPGVRAARTALLVGSEMIAARQVAHEHVADWQQSWVPATPPKLELVPDDRLFPVRLPLEAGGMGQVGWLLLGPHPDGTLYGKDERDALVEVAAPIARALRIAREQVAWREHYSALASSLSERMARLEDALSRLIDDNRLPAEG